MQIKIININQFEHKSVVGLDKAGSRTAKGGRDCFPKCENVRVDLSRSISLGTNYFLTPKLIQHWN